MSRQNAQVVVLGAGPGGYAAAFHCADLGLEVVLVDDRERPGGVCLNVGCIPSKALLHAAQVMEEAREAEKFGITFGKPRIKLQELRSWKEKIVSQLTGGLGQLAKHRGVEYIRGRATFLGSNEILIKNGEERKLTFESAIIASGSRPAALPAMPASSERIMDSTDALELDNVPATLLVVGGGYIGLELGTVYAALGSKVTVVELLDNILPGVDKDLIRPLERSVKAKFEAVHVRTRVASMKETHSGVEVSFEGELTGVKSYERVLIAVGRVPNSGELGLENTSIRVGPKGFIEIDRQCRTSQSNVFAIGDVAGQPMLAHKAMREGKVAAEVLAGKRAEFDNLAIPAVVFTNPEVAWVGLMEDEAREQGFEVKVTRFPWAASGRSLTLGRSDGLTKMVFEAESGRILGLGIVGPSAGELIAEGTLAIEMSAVAEDVALTIHTHPTLSETVGEVAEMFLGHATHIFKK